MMKEDPNWTPLGCGPCTDGDPDFPKDLLLRINHLDLGEEELFLAWELVRLAGGDLDSQQQRALMLLVLAARFISAEGSTRLPLFNDGYPDRVLKEFKTPEGEVTAVKKLLAAALGENGGQIPSPLADLFGGPGDYRPLIIDQGCLYIQKFHVLETRVGKNLRARLNSDPAVGGGPTAGIKMQDLSYEKALREVYDNPPHGPLGKIVLDAEQKEAVRAALRGRIVIISGRPGSGKTSIVAGVLRVLARLGQPSLESMALAAPTGKAADRMRQAIADHLSAIPKPDAADCRLAASCPPSLTLHRLLGYSPGKDRFWHNEYNPLSEQLVFVDESSMVDLVMMDQLLRALPPESRLILLGDADQLPAVGVGSVLGDLCRSERAIEGGRVVVLKHSYRARKEDSAGKKILDAAAAINACRLPLDAVNREPFNIVNRPEELCFQGVEHWEAAGEEQVEAFWARWEDMFWSGCPNLQEMLRLEYVSGPDGFDEHNTCALRTILKHYERFKILCATRVTAGETGSEIVNRRFHYRWREKFKAFRVSRYPHFLVGEPVMVSRNDYNLRLFNGDSGLILMIKFVSATGDGPSKPMAVFPRGGGFAAYPLQTLRGRVERAWAITVHKAQGSEYDHVAILLPGLPVRPLTKELLYTAVTRARKSVTIVGPWPVLESGIRRKMERVSGLADMLKVRPAGG